MASLASERFPGWRCGHDWPARTAERGCASRVGSTIDNPITLTESVAVGALVLAFTGSNDTVVPPRLVTGYIDVLKKRGVDARYIEIPGATHSWKSLFNNEIAEGGLQELLRGKMTERGQ